MKKKWIIMGVGFLALFILLHGSEENCKKGGIRRLGMACLTDPENLRVVLTTPDMSGIYRREVTITSTDIIRVSYEEKDGKIHEERWKPQEPLHISVDDLAETGSRVRVETEKGKDGLRLAGEERYEEDPGYPGSLELIPTDKGIVVINELPLEEYLTQVVPSEMPPTYPKEALKAQAVCARTYAYAHMLSPGYAAYGAHLDDSTRYQVYHRKPESENSTEAVRETKGQILLGDDGGCGDAFYYSTSCGFGTDVGAWDPEVVSASATRVRIGEEKGGVTGEDMQVEALFRQFIGQVWEEDFESGEKWYRWECSAPKADIRAMAEYMKNELHLSFPEFNKILDIRVEKRSLGGAVCALILNTENGEIRVCSERNIRKLLGLSVEEILCGDGSVRSCEGMLPSGFFAIDVVSDGESVVGYKIVGGGYGHGIGMSQNGAKQMALSGYSADEILAFFYEDCSLGRLGEVIFSQGKDGTGD